MSSLIDYLCVMSKTEANPEPITRPWWMRPIAWITAAVVALALLIGGATLLRGPSENLTACKLYEDGYNQLADATRHKLDGTGSTDEVRDQFARLPGRIMDAQRVAEGDVAVEMRSSWELAQAYLGNPNSEDIGTAFFLSTTHVSKACSAGGAAIDLHPNG